MWLRLSIAIVVAGTTAVIPTPVQAQAQIDITPHVGMYFPLNSAVAEASQDLTMRQVSAVVLGGHLALHAADTAKLTGPFGSGFLRSWRTSSTRSRP